MPSKTKLLEKARARARDVPSRDQVKRALARPGSGRPLQHKVVAVSLFPAERDWLEATVQDLRRAGVTKPNLSEIVRVAIGDLRGQLTGKKPEEIRDYIAKIINGADR